MTGQSLLDMMEALDNENHLQTGEDDVARALVCLNIAQDQFEAIVAQFPKLLGDTTGTVTTSANTETTAFPTGVLRIDKLQYLDPTTSRPAWTLENTKEVGTHSDNRFWPWNLFSTSVSGKPRGYWTNGTSIYWNPLPDGTNTIRWYGFEVKTDITALGTFLYPDIVAFPLAAFASKIMSIGVGDDVGELAGEAQSAFASTIGALSRFDRTTAEQLHYTQVHLA